MKKKLLPIFFSLLIPVVGFTTSCGNKGKNEYSESIKKSDVPISENDNDEETVHDDSQEKEEPVINNEASEKTTHINNEGNQILNVITNDNSNVGAIDDNSNEIVQEQKTPAVIHENNIPNSPVIENVQTIVNYPIPQEIVQNRPSLNIVKPIASRINVPPQLSQEELKRIQDEKLKSALIREIKVLSWDDSLDIAPNDGIVINNMATYDEAKQNFLLSKSNFRDDMQLSKIVEIKKQLDNSLNQAKEYFRVVSEQNHFQRNILLTKIKNYPWINEPEIIPVSTVSISNQIKTYTQAKNDFDNAKSRINDDLQIQEIREINSILLKSTNDATNYNQLIATKNQEEKTKIIQEIANLSWIDDSEFNSLSGVDFLKEYKSYLICKQEFNRIKNQDHDSLSFNELINLKNRLNDIKVKGNNYYNHLTEIMSTIRSTYFQTKVTTLSEINALHWDLTDNIHLLDGAFIHEYMPTYTDAKSSFDFYSSIPRDIETTSTMQLIKIENRMKLSIQQAIDYQNAVTKANNDYLNERKNYFTKRINDYSWDEYREITPLSGVTIDPNMVTYEEAKSAFDKAKTILSKQNPTLDELIAASRVMDDAMENARNYYYEVSNQNYLFTKT
ncbi:MAG: hypothetical protein NC236_01925 [Mycoplasma sp.]|nr:hypothetical protein [Mycoplasma sp.]